MILSLSLASSALWKSSRMWLAFSGLAVGTEGDPERAVDQDDVATAVLPYIADWNRNAVLGRMLSQSIVAPIRSSAGVGRGGALIVRPPSLSRARSSEHPAFPAARSAAR